MHGSVFLGDGRQSRCGRRCSGTTSAPPKQCAEIESKAGGREALIELVANPALTGFTAPKILWVREHEPKIYAKTKHILLPKDYIRFRMTGEYATEVSDASGTLLLDVVEPHVVGQAARRCSRSTSRCCRACTNRRKSPARSTPRQLAPWVCAEGIPVVGGAGDQAAGAVGNGIVTAGIVSATLGTSGVVFAHARPADARPAGPRPHDVPRRPGQVVRLRLHAQRRRQLPVVPQPARPGRSRRREEEERSIRTSCSSPRPQQAPPGCEGLFFLPYLTGERCPHPDPNARGGWIGLTARTTARHAHPLPARRRHLRHARCPGDHAQHEHPHHPGPRQRRRRAHRTSGDSSRPTSTSSRSSSPTPPKAPPTASRCSPASAPASGAASKKPAGRASSRHRKSPPIQKRAAKYETVRTPRIAEALSGSERSIQGDGCAG